MTTGARHATEAGGVWYAPVRGEVHADDLVLEGILGFHLGSPLGDERVAEQRGRPRSHAAEVTIGVRAAVADSSGRGGRGVRERV